MPTLRTFDLTKSYGGRTVVRGVNLDVSSGEVVGLLGPNGAGKTTLLRIVATLLRPTDGRAAVGGYDVVREPEPVRQLIGLAGQSAAVDEMLTARENLKLVGRLYGLDRSETKRRIEELLTRFELDEAADRLVRTYSGGMRRRLDLAATLIGHPRVVLLDEPTAGLDPRSRRELWDLVDSIARDGVTILVTSQYLEEIERLAQRVIVLDKGRIVADGPIDELKAAVGHEDGNAASLDDVFFRLTGDGATVTLAPPRLQAGAPMVAVELDVRRHAIVDMLAITHRYLLRFVRIPQLLFLSAAQPLVFLVMLNAVFGGVVAATGVGSYIQYLLPGIVVMSVVLGGSVTSAGVAEDLQAGVVDRFRSLPMSRSAVLVGRTVADTIRCGVGLVIVGAVGVAMGFDFASPGRAVAVLALVLCFSFAVAWLFAAVGMAVKQAEAAQLAGFLPSLPLTFISGAWIPVGTMAGPLQAFARNQPVNVMIEAVRALSYGQDATASVMRAAAWTCAILVVAVPLCVRQYRTT